MRWASVCSGIGAPECAWGALWGQPRWVSEIDPFASAVLRHHYPEVPNLGDMTRIARDERPVPPIELLVGGTPCQDFSVAGLRAGLAGERGRLTVEFCHLLERTRPRWVVWENVPGVLSIDGGQAFGTFLGMLGQLGYGWAYRVLDAQFFGVPQRRRRVFVVGHLGDWRPAAAVLFERHSLSGHPAPRRQAGQGTAGGAAGSPAVGNQVESDYSPVAGGQTARYGKGTDSDACDALVFQCQGSNVGEMGTLRRGDGGLTSGVPFVAHSLRAEGHDGSEDGTGRGVPLVFSETGPGWWSEGVSALRAEGGGGDPRQIAVVPFDTTQITSDKNYSQPRAGDTDHPLAAGSHPPADAFTAYPIQDGTNVNKSQGSVGVGDEGDPAYTLSARENQGVAYVAPVARTQSASYGKSTANDGSSDPQVVAFDWKKGGGGADRSFRAKSRAWIERAGDYTGALRADSQDAVATHSAVRRLTPLECERLMGFPDDWTLIPHGKNRTKDFLEWFTYLRARLSGLTENQARALAADAPRYRVLGNSMAVPVVRWIGERIQTVEDALLEGQEGAA